MSISLNMSVTQGVKEGGKFLDAGIKDAIFKGVRPGTVNGKDGATYKTMEIVFDINGYGEYIHKVFEPKSAERTSTDFGQGPVIGASPVESFLLTCRHMLDTAAPEIAKGIEDGSIQISGSFDDVVAKMAAYTVGFIGKATQIKLLPGKDGFSNMPSGFKAARVNKNGGLYLPTRYIGDNLTLTSYEIDAINKAKVASPTNMSSTSALSGMNIDMGADDSDDLPF